MEEGSFSKIQEMQGNNSSIIPSSLLDDQNSLGQEDEIATPLGPNNPVVGESSINNEVHLSIPAANVMKIMRRAMPPDANVSNEAKEFMQECVTKFISFVTNKSHEFRHLEHRQTISAEGVIGALSRVGLDDYVEPLSLYIQKYRESRMQSGIPRSGAMNQSHQATFAANDLPAFNVGQSHSSMFDPSVCDGNVVEGAGPSTP